MTRAALVLLAVAAVQDQASSPLSLDAAIARALAANRTILAARAARAIDTAGVAVAGQRPNPEVNVEVERETPHWAFGATVPLEVAGIPLKSEGVRNRVADYGSTERLETGDDRELASTNKAVEAAIAEAEHAAHPGTATPPTPPVAPDVDEPPPAAPAP